MESKVIDREIARYVSTNHLLMSYMEKGESRVKFAMKTAALDVWVELVGAMTELDSDVDQCPYLSVIDDRYLLKSHDCPDHTAHNDCEDREGRRPRCFVSVSGSEDIRLIVCLALHAYVQF